MSSPFAFVAIASAALASGCFFKPGPPGNGTDRDGGPDAPYPETFGPFQSPRSLGNLHDTGSDFGPFVSTNPLELFFTSARSGSPVLWVATRSDAMQPFMTAPSEVGFGGGDSQIDGTLTLDGLDLYFRDGSNTLFHMHRISLGAPWSAPTQSGIDLQVTGPFDFGGNDLRVVMGSTRSPTDPTSEIIESVRSGGTWSIPGPSLGLHTGSTGETSPSLSFDGLELFYEKQTVSGGVETWRATRPSLAESFSGALFTIGIHTKIGDAELSPDGLDLYFCELAGSDYQLWVSHRDPL